MFNTGVTWWMIVIAILTAIVVFKLLKWLLSNIVKLNPSTGTGWLKNVSQKLANNKLVLKIGLGYIVLNAGFWLLHPKSYYLWVTDYTLSFIGIHSLIILLMAMFIALDGKKHGGFKWLMVLVIFGVIFTSLAKEPTVVKNLEKVVPQAKATSTPTTPQPPQQYVIVAPPAPDWSQPLSSDVAAMIGSWRNMASRSDGDFRWKSNKSEGLLLDKELLRVYPGEWWHIRFQSATGQKNTIILTKRN